MKTLPQKEPKKCGSRRLTHEEYLQRLADRNRTDLVPLEPYVLSIIPIKHKCTFGHIWKTRPNNVFHGGTGCPVCAGTRKITRKVYLERLALADRTDIVEIGPVRGINKKTLHTCSQGHTWLTKPSTILRGCGCPTCAGTAKLTHEEYLARLQGTGITPLTSYISGKTPIMHRCLNGHEWLAAPFLLQYKGRCPTCSGYTPRERKNQKPPTFDEWVDYLAEKDVVFFEPDYTPAKVRYQYPCDCQVEQTAAQVRILDRICPNCKGLSNAVFDFYASKIKHLDLVPLEQFISTKRKIRHRFLCCGRESAMSPRFVLTKLFICKTCGTKLR